jgi:hypothetical protein
MTTLRRPVLEEPTPREQEQPGAATQGSLVIIPTYLKGCGEDLRSAQQGTEDEDKISERRSMCPAGKQVMECNMGNRPGA